MPACHQSTFRLFREPPDLTNTPGAWREAEALHTPSCPCTTLKCLNVTIIIPSQVQITRGDVSQYCVPQVCKMIFCAPGQGTSMSCIAYPLRGLEVFQTSACDSDALRWPDTVQLPACSSSSPDPQRSLILWVSLSHRHYSIIEVVREGNSEDMIRFCALIQRQRLLGDALPGFAFLAPDKL